MWLTAVTFRFTRPAFHRGRSGYFTFVQREHMPTCKIAMHKCAFAHNACNRSSDLAFRSRMILIGRFAVGLALFQREYPTCELSAEPSARVLHQLRTLAFTLNEREN